jgi:hypothetical protein
LAVYESQPLIEDGLVPFFIDWGQTHIRGLGATQPGAAVAARRASRPDVSSALSAVGVTLPISHASQPSPDRNTEYGAGRGRASMTISYELWEPAPAARQANNLRMEHVTVRNDRSRRASTLKISPGLNVGAADRPKRYLDRI